MEEFFADLVSIHYMKPIFYYSSVDFVKVTNRKAKAWTPLCPSHVARNLKLIGIRIYHMIYQHSRRQILLVKNQSSTIYNTFYTIQIGVHKLVMLRLYKFLTVYYSSCILSNFYNMRWCGCKNRHVVFCVCYRYSNKYWHMYPSEENLSSKNYLLRIRLFADILYSLSRGTSLFETENLMASIIIC